MFSITNIAYSTVGLLTLNMLNGIIIGTSNTLQTIYYILSSKNKNLNSYKNQIETFDIEFKLKIVNEWIIKNKDDTNNTTYIKENIGQICIKISDMLDQINQKISYHNTKWLSSWRTLDIKDDIIFLEKYCNILNQRLYLINC